MRRGFTLIELLVVIAIVAVLSSIILFAIKQFIDKGMDSNVSANLAVLIPAGEAYYNIDNTYAGFCSINVNAVKNAFSQMPENDDGSCPSTSTNPAGVCCTVACDGDVCDAWAACAEKFTDPAYAFCVDSRGVKKDISASSCSLSAGITQCP